MLAFLMKRRNHDCCHLTASKEAEGRLKSGIRQKKRDWTDCVSHFKDSDPRLKMENGPLHCHCHMRAACFGVHTPGHFLSHIQMCTSEPTFYDFSTFTGEYVLKIKLNWWRNVMTEKYVHGSRWRIYATTTEKLGNVQFQPYEICRLNYSNLP